MNMNDQVNMNEQIEVSVRLRDTGTAGVGGGYFYVCVLLVAQPFSPSDEGLLVPFKRWKHVGAIVDAKNCHLIWIFQILK